MLNNELADLVRQIQRQGCETQTIEVKAAAQGAPRIYDTLSSFSNQQQGGVILFGIDEASGYQTVGVYDAQDLQNRIREMGEEMEPVVRPVMTVWTLEDGRSVVSAEIMPLDLSERPCFKRTAGRLQGSYVRVGNSDQRMTDYEVYAFQAYRRRIREDVREITGLHPDVLDPVLVQTFRQQRTHDRPNIAALDDGHMMELLNITRNGSPTLMALLMFGRFPQITLPGLSIKAVRIPGTQMGAAAANGTRFTASERLEGTLSEMLTASVAFVAANMRTSIGVDSATGARFDIPEYPLEAVREVLLNALIHRDYSVHTESMAIQLQMFSDRLEVHSPGGLYGRLSVEDLGSAQPETRNQALVAAMETMGYAENRYSGIPRIRQLMAEAGLPEPEFESRRGQFTVRLYNHAPEPDVPHENIAAQGKPPHTSERSLLEFCSIPRSREEIALFLGIASQGYAISRYVSPLVKSGQLQLTVPDKPKSSRQRYRAASATKNAGLSKRT